jgi:superfamily II DNA/RNA helicase
MREPREFLKKCECILNSTGNWEILFSSNQSVCKRILKMTAFEEFGLIPELGKAVDDMDWLLPTDVQAEAIPLILGGKL